MGKTSVILKLDLDLFRHLHTFTHKTWKEKQEVSGFKIKIFNGVS